MDFLNIHAMAKYLDPKADLTFKKIFSNHPDLLISLLNSLLPLDADRQIESIEYLPEELVPETPLRKDSIVDVRCKDRLGRQFVVEMQMQWSRAFMQRVLLNASKAYVSQAEDAAVYAKLKNVYSLNLVNDVFMNDIPEFIHNYNIVHEKYSDRIIPGLSFTFIELPKFQPTSFMEKRMAVLWLRFLTEINSKTVEVDSELLADPQISRAITAVRTSAYSEAELRAYDRFWDSIMRERTLVYDGVEEGRERGFAEGMEKGMAEGIEKGIAATAKKMKDIGMPVETIMQVTSLTKEEIKGL